VPTWGKGQFASSEVREVELELEKKVSEYIGRLSLLWLNVPDKPGPASDRAYIEKNSIGLLAGSNGPIDIPSKNLTFCANMWMQWQGELPCPTTQ